MNKASAKRAGGAVAITGVGIVSALGVGAEEWLAAYAEGEAAFAEMTTGETGGESALAAPVQGYDVAPLLETRKAYLDRHTALLLGTMSLALRQSGWDRESLPHGRAGLMVGSAWGGLGTMTTFFRDVLTKGAKFAKPILFPHAYANTAAAMGAIEWALQGPHEQYAGGPLASAQALVAALDTLRAGDAEVMLAGGCEALSPAVFRTLAAQGGLGDSVPGEGAAVLVLEPIPVANARNATVLALLAGAGISGDSLEAACIAACAEAGVAPGEFGGVFASGSGWQGGSRDAMASLHAVFEGHCPPVTELHRLQGDCLGAATAMDTAAAVLLLCERSLSARRTQMVVAAAPEGYAALVLQGAG